MANPLRLTLACLLLVASVGCGELLEGPPSLSDVRVENETLDAAFTVEVTLTHADGRAPETIAVMAGEHVQAGRERQWDEVFESERGDSVFVDIDVRWLGRTENYTIDTEASPGDTLELTYDFDSVEGRNGITWRWAPF